MPHVVVAHFLILFEIFFRIPKRDPHTHKSPAQRASYFEKPAWYQIDGFNASIFDFICMVLLIVALLMSLSLGD